jgi:hypothetical protein
MHMQANRAIRDKRTDIAAADDAKHLASDLDAHEAILLPFAGLGRGIGDRDLARERKHQGDRMFGCGDGIAERRIHYDGALCGRGRDIDIVDANASAADDSELRRLFENLGRNLCC